MIEKNKQARDNNNAFAAVLTDLFKTFDRINYELLVAKLNAYGFDSLSLKFISAYLNFRNRKLNSVLHPALLIYSAWCSARIYGWATYFQCLHLRYVFPNWYFWVPQLCTWKYSFSFRTEPRKINKVFAKHLVCLSGTEKTTLKLMQVKCHLFLSIFSNKEMANASYNTRFIFIRKRFIRKWASNPQNLKKMLRKKLIKSSL